MRGLIMIVTMLGFQIAHAANANLRDKNSEFVKGVAFKVIQKRVIEKFRPSDINKIEALRIEKNGIVDFLFTSQNGEFRGDAYCSYTELLMYSDKYSNPDSVCPRINVFEQDKAGMNDIGRQVGIY